MSLKKIQLAFALAVTGAFCLFPAVAHAAPVVDQTQTLNNVGTTGPLCSTGMMASNSIVGSVFTAGLTGSLTSVSFPISQTSSTDNLQVSIYSLSAGLPSGQPLATQTISASTLVLLAQGGTLTVVFDTPASVVSGTGYAFTFGFPSCSSFSQLTIAEGVAPADKRLVFNQNNSQTWVKETTYGMNFSTYVEVPQVQSSPSPSSTQSSSQNSTTQVLAQTGSETNYLVPLWFGLGLLLSSSGFVLIARYQKQKR